MSRPMRYNKQLEGIENLESIAQIDVIRPEKPMKVERLTTDTVLMKEFYDEGCNLT